MNRSLERARSVHGIVSGLDEVPFRRVRKLECNAPVRQTMAHAPQLNVRDLGELFFIQRVEYDDLVHAIEELGAEMLPQLIQHRSAHDRIIGSTRVALVIEDPVAADVRGHDDDRIPKIDRAALDRR